MSSGIFLVPLTNSQRMALVDILIEHMMDPASTQEFLDLAAGKTTTHRELILLLDRATWFSGISAEKIINSFLGNPANVES